MIGAHGAGWVSVRRRLPAGLVAGAIAAILLTGCGSGATSTANLEPTYGDLPTFLPTDSLQPDSVLTGTTARPALTTQGDVVQVVAGNGASVRAVVSGPDVPGEGLPYQSPATTCTWTVALTGATGEISVDIADFSTIDHLGTVYHPTLRAGRKPPPATIRPGQQVTFELQAVMRTGEGLMRWAPGRPNVAASWDFEVEND